MSQVQSASVIRSGTALEILFSGGAKKVFRRVDLAIVLGTPTAASRRFAAAVAADDGSTVRLTYADGTGETLGAACFVDAAARVARERRAELVVDNAGMVLTADSDDGDLLGLVRRGAVVCGGGRVLWVGASADIGRCGYDLGAAERIDAGGRLVTPGLIDCHAHPLFAGNRADEFGRRAAGQSYLEIAAAGGGIMATVEPTRQLGSSEHVALTMARMDRALAAGTTTCEAKSGYDLRADGELGLLEIAWAVDALHRVDLVPTLLGAHALPPEYAGNRAAYVSLVADTMIPEAARRGLSRTADVYCDQGAFTLDETRVILEAAKRAGMSLRVHAGQFADLGAAELIAELGGLSADHLEVVSERGIAAMAAHGVVAVMLPGACTQLRMTPPPVAALRRAGVAMAVATDLNPGTSMSESLPVQMWLAATHYGMTVPEVWLGVTRIAARAMGRHDIGILTPGAAADMVIWDSEIPADVPYHYGVDLVHKVIKAGRVAG